MARRGKGRTIDYEPCKSANGRSLGRRERETYACQGLHLLRSLGCTVLPLGSLRCWCRTLLFPFNSSSGAPSGILVPSSVLSLTFLLTSLSLGITCFFVGRSVMSCNLRCAHSALPTSDCIHRGNYLCSLFVCAAFGEDIAQTCDGLCDTRLHC